jgi:hypothetical protein
MARAEPGAALAAETDAAPATAAAAAIDTGAAEAERGVGSQVVIASVIGAVFFVLIAVVVMRRAILG